MNLIYTFVLIPIAGILLIPFTKVKGKGIITLVVLMTNVLISCNIAIKSFTGKATDLILAGSYVTGPIPIRIDSLSGWFILVINLIFLTGGLYGFFYLKKYRERTNCLTLHSISFLLQYSALISICAIQNSFVFLIAWEILALSSFVLIVFEHENPVNIKAGINYLIQAHFSILFLMVGFLWVINKTNSFDFTAITQYTASIPNSASLILFICFFIAFSIKAGFVPFHTWLPYAHPAAPSHVSGMMSGVVIKIGIFGILRMLLLFKTDFTFVGYSILIFSVLSGLYGVMLAIVQHNLKKLLAYHSVENIGIIGIGLGIGCIGVGSGNNVLSALGFTGALLHTLNHAIFKSMLFYTAGNIYQATHTMEIEKLGGVIKKMPQTSILFLISAIAICGIPPLNGFVSEFILYSGLYAWLSNGTLFSLLAAIFSTIAMVAIGGLAMICFTKAFGIIFLGSERHPLPPDCQEVSFQQLLPVYILSGFLISIGLFPQFFFAVLGQTVGLFTGNLEFTSNPFNPELGELMRSISIAGWILVALISSIFMIRRFFLRSRKAVSGTTWGCGYIHPTAKQQYTASSFVRTYGKLFAPVLWVEKEEKPVGGVFPKIAEYRTHPFDRLEKGTIDRILKMNKRFMGRFVFVNNGKLQFYILYGIIFIVLVLGLPVIIQNIESFIDILKHL
jgi:formate hydrogenlyase subunit 3/multisubunit Na+/H+ antiporter MnhD subunit